MMLNAHRHREAYLGRGKRGGGRGYGYGGKREIIYLSLHCRHTTWSLDTTYSVSLDTFLKGES